MTIMDSIIRQRIKVNGIVQGVGFRPFVYNLAIKNNLNGFVSNTSDGVVIELEGAAGVVDQFLESMSDSPPPLSSILSLDANYIQVANDCGFKIITSKSNNEISTQISPDAAICRDCLNEISDVDNRRFEYPFTNCTNCGPRYTIIKELPYDRHLTTMSDFKMCSQCKEEYDNPMDRRFHAQPNACPDCGPSLTLTARDGKSIASSDKISTCISLLKSGFIVAIKGLGGFHLMVDATNSNAVSRLRTRKNREEKPFAVMAKNLDHARDLCHICGTEEIWLTSIQSPIMLLKSIENNNIASNVAPGSEFLGVMLPYTPLHDLLMNCIVDVPPLVMTSGNLSDEPICIDNDEALDQLGDIADYFLLHDRRIHIRADDSVVMIINNKPRVIRRSRGFAPAPVILKNNGPSVLAVGGDLKNTICLLKNKNARISQHNGDLENLKAYETFQQTIHHLKDIFDIQPDILACDMHPGYFSTQWAKSISYLPLFEVQHHHAHLASGMAEFGLENPVIGIIMDGTGYGLDKTIWGGEFLVGDYHGFQRINKFQNMPLPGGDAAIKSPWRTAIGYLFKTYGDSLPDLPFMMLHDYEPVIQIVQKGINSPLTSSCGRLFDAVSAMCGGKQEIRYEGQAAIEFMNAAAAAGGRSCLDFEIIGDVVSVESIIRSIVKCLKMDDNLSVISRKFHNTMIKIFTQVAIQISKDTGINDVVLSGGVFQNRILLSGVNAALEKNGLSVFSHEQIPTNDGGISLGQAMIARNKLHNNKN
jgi:hydrogenase maturation protein HypF